MLIGLLPRRFVAPLNGAQASRRAPVPSARFAWRKRCARPAMPCSKITPTCVLAAVATWVSAHTPEAVESMLRKDERYAQFVDYEAPDFRLADSAGRQAALADFSGKVAVLTFIYMVQPCEDNDDY